MLVLTRCADENIMIGDRILIKVLSVSEDAGNVRIQVEAPDFVAIQCRDVDSQVADFKAGPIITNKRRWRLLVTK
jgi:carbon storage regulator